MTVLLSDRECGEQRRRLAGMSAEMPLRSLLRALGFVPYLESFFLGRCHGSLG